MRIIKQSLGGGSGVSTADGTAIPSEVLDGEVVYVNDVRIIGTMPNIGAETITPVAAGASISEGYHDGTGGIVPEANFVATNIKDGVTIWGLEGSYIEGTATTSITGTVDAEFIARDKLKIGDIVYTVQGNILGEEKIIEETSKIVTFSPDGKLLIVGGGFIGYAKIYSVSGTTLTYISDIYADSGTAALEDYVEHVTFSPDGTKMVLCTYNGYAKIYSVSGTTVTYISDIYADSGTTKFSYIVLCAVFSPDGGTLVITGMFQGYAKIYSVSGTTVTYISDIYADSGTTVLNGAVYQAAFSPNGTELVLGGNFTGYGKIYSVSGTTVTYISNISSLNNAVYSLAFSPSGNILIFGGFNTMGAKIYSVSGTTVTFVSNIYADAGTTTLTSVRSIAFSSDETRLILGGDFVGYAKIYSVSGTAVTYVSDIYADLSSTPLDDTVWSLVFSPDETKIVMAGDFVGAAKVYSVSGTTATYVLDIILNATVEIDHTVNSVTFSPDGTKLVLGGKFSGYAKIYSVSGNIISYISDIYADLSSTPLGSDVLSVAFSPDGTVLVIGGYFWDGYAKVYSVSGTAVTYVSDIYADLSSTPLDNYVDIATFSQDGTLLILSGYFDGCAKIYSVSGTTVTYVSDIYADLSSTPLDDDVYSIAFSPDGTVLVISGYFDGCAKIYSVSGTTVTYVSDIYADLSSTPLDDDVLSVAFSSDGTVLVIGGYFDGYAKVYSVSGTAVTYVSDIYADLSSTPLDSDVLSVAFSSDGTRLILGGSFVGNAKIYSVSGTTVTYVSDIYADLSSTPLDSDVLSVAFSPDGTKMVLYTYNGYAKIYSVSGTTVTYAKYAYKKRLLLSGSNYYEVGIGYATEDAEVGERVTIRLLSEY